MTCDVGIPPQFFLQQGRPETLLASQNSLSFFVSMTTAMASDTSLFKLGMVSLVTDPPLFPVNPCI